MSKIVTATFIFIVALVFFVILLFFIRKNFIEQKQKAVSFVSPIPKQEITQEVTQEEGPSVLAEKAKLEVATLKSFTDLSLEGSATRSTQGKKFMLSIDASLPDTESDTFYQVWLVKSRYGTPDFDYLAVGKLVKVGEKYNLEFSEEADYSQFKTVVITQEKVEDNTPEVHVLEGGF